MASAVELLAISAWLNFWHTPMSKLRRFYAPAAVPPLAAVTDIAMVKYDGNDYLAEQRALTRALVRSARRALPHEAVPGRRTVSLAPTSRPSTPSPRPDPPSSTPWLPPMSHPFSGRSMWAATLGLHQN